MVMILVRITIKVNNVYNLSTEGNGNEPENAG